MGAHSRNPTRLKREDLKFEVSLGYVMRRPISKLKEKEKEGVEE